MADLDPDRAATEAMKVAGIIGQDFLHGRGPELQGAILAELVGMWLAGHAPDLREHAKAMWDNVVDDLTRVNSNKLWGTPMEKRTHGH